MKEQSAERARVFFALWPDAVVAAHLHAIALRWHGSLGGRVMREDSLHTTLSFIGDVETSRLPALLALAAEIELPGFAMAFDSADCWRHNQIAYLAMRQMPAALQSLQSELSARVLHAGFVLETRPYRPHITLLRKADCRVENTIKENPATEPVAWSVRDFVLVKSSLSANGSRYEQIGRWPLLKDDATS
jgi:2'-5' RNA ligase